MKKPSKETVIKGIQFCLTMYMMIQGFFLTYTWIFWEFGLFEWWTSLIAICIAMLSTWGLFQWICNS